MRLPYLDNLRWSIILLVISIHADSTYNNMGLWYYNEPVQLSNTHQTLLVSYIFLLHTFNMGLLFFIAGYFTPRSFDRKGPRKFLMDRISRLGWPALLYVFILSPVTGYLATWRRSAGNIFTTFGHEYANYILKGKFIYGVGPLWFSITLLVFCGIYVCRRLLDTTDRPVVASAFPGAGRILGFLGLLAAATFIVRIYWPLGTAFYNLQFCYWPQYIAFFIAGTLAWRNDWLSGLSVATGKRWGSIGLFGGLACYMLLLVAGGGKAGYAGGWHWQSLIVSAFDALMGVGISFGLITFFRERLNRQGKLLRLFSANAFAVYIFHAPVLVVVTRVMSGWNAGVLTKLLLSTLLAFAITITLSATVFRRTPLLKRIL